MQAMVPFARQLSALHPATLDGEALGALLSAAEVLEAHFTLARTEAMRRLNAGQRVEGWEIVPTEGRRSVPDTILAARQMAPLLEPHEFLACCKPSIGKLIDAVQAAEDVSEKEAKEIVADYLKGNIVKGAGGEELRPAPKTIELHPSASSALKAYQEEKNHG